MKDAWHDSCVAASASYSPELDEENDSLHWDSLKKLVALAQEQQRRHERQLCFLMDYLGLSRLELEQLCRDLDAPLPILYDKILAGWYLADGKLCEPISNGIAHFGLAID